MLVLTVSVILICLVQPSSSFNYQRLGFVSGPSRKVVFSVSTKAKTSMLSTLPRAASDASYSFIEGDDYQNPFDELEAIGGDPSFLDPVPGQESFSLDQDVGIKEFNFDTPNAPTDSDKNYLWDGIVDDEAHLGY